MIIMGCHHGEFFYARINVKHKTKNPLLSTALLFSVSTLSEFHEERGCFLYFTDRKQGTKKLDDLLGVTVGKKLSSAC